MQYILLFYDFYCLLIFFLLTPYRKFFFCKQFHLRIETLIFKNYFIYLCNMNKSLNELYKKQIVELTQTIYRLRTKSRVFVITENIIVLLFPLPLL